MMTDREAIEYFEAIFETEALGKTDIEAMNIAISALREREERATNWISVKERLPENDYNKHWKDRKRYLVTTKPNGLMRVTEFGYKEYGWWIDSHDCVMSAANSKEVTHWMPLPDPPKEEA